jgi:exosortase/archaeosortase family protein
MVWTVGRELAVRCAQLSASKKIDVTTSDAAMTGGPSRPNRNQALHYLVRALALGGLAYAALYFPYPPGSFPVRALAWYLRQVARASGALVWLFDRQVFTSGDLVEGAFSLRIVLDCAALDAQALFAAAVLAFPARWWRRALGLLVGSALLALVNVGRIVLLYAAGIWWPDAFHILHEEILQLAIVLTAVCSFLAWIVWVQRPTWTRA